MKVSLIATVYNEEKSIKKLLESITVQSSKPDEVIFVDAGSKDRTVAIIRSYKERIKNLQVLVRKGVNRSVGRNIAISKARGKIIAVTDAGCYLDKKWLLEITKPIKSKSNGVVAGYYLPNAETIFQKSVAPYFCVMSDNIERESLKKSFEFLPSSRSLAFLKSVWKKVDGYPESLNYCEDLVFDQKIKKAGFNIQFNPEALVYWPQKNSLQAVFRQFYHYAFGDGQVFFSPYQTHTKKILSLYIRFVVAFLLFVLCLLFPEYGKYLVFIFACYLLADVWLKYKYVNHVLALIYLPAIRIVADMAVMMGSLMGILKTSDKVKKASE